MSMRLADFIRERRCQMRLTLRQLGERAGVSAPFLSDVEHGRRWPSQGIMETLAKALEVEPAALFDLDDRPKLHPLERRMAELERRVAALESRGLVLR